MFADILDAVLAPTAPAGPDTDTGTGAPAAGAALGIRVLDDLLGPLQPGRLYLVAAAPGVGGSLLATAAARTTALERNLPVLYAASGPTAADVTARIVAAHLPVDYRRLRAGQLTDGERDEVRFLYGELAAAPLYLYDGAGLTAADVAATASEALVVVDRLQTARDARLPLSGPAQVTDAAQELAHLARTLRVPVLAVLDSPTPATAPTGPHLATEAGPRPAAARSGADAGLAADVRVLLAADGTWVHATVTERNLGVLGDTVLHADLAHARLTDPPARTTPPPPPGAAPGQAPAPGHGPTAATPHPASAAPAAHGHVPNAPAESGASPNPGPAAPGAAGTGQAAGRGAWPEVTRPGTAPRPAAAAPSAPAAAEQHTADAPAPGKAALT